jgi:prepilin-type N-terminal cleavage/methylation domain-containing protein/prepilin-type processing-associated H-X9-DG protein
LKLPGNQFCRRGLPFCAATPAFTLIELLVVIAIVVLLAAFAFPAIKSAMLSARSAESLSNQKQIGVLVANYAAENNNRLPYAAVWSKIFGGQLVYFSRALAEGTDPKFEYGKAPYTAKRPLPSIFYDPSLEGDRREQHAMGAFGVNRSIVVDVWDRERPSTSLSSIAQPSRKVILCSVDLKSAPESGGWMFTGDDFANQGTSVDGGPDPRNAGRAAALFADGHVEKLDVKNMDEATRRRLFTLDAAP